jgi:hypothetical protein
METPRTMLRSKGIIFGQGVFLTVGLMILAIAILSGCSQIPGVTYSVEDQFTLARARAPQLTEQLQFSIRLDPDSVSVGQDIFFVATFTNTTDDSFVFREPEQNDVWAFEDFDTLLLFAVEPISGDLELAFPGQSGFVSRIARPVMPDEFMELPAHASREIRLQLPHEAQLKHAPPNVFGMYSAEGFPLPVGQYQVQITYINEIIGYEVKLLSDYGFVDLNAWVGRTTSNPVPLTVTP